MTECERYEPSLSAWLDGEEAGEDRIEIVDHLVRCADCRRFYRGGRELAGLTVLAVGGEGHEVSPERWAGIVEAAAVRPRRQWALPAWALRAAAVLLVAAGLVYSLGRPALSTWPRPSSPAAASVEVVLEENADEMTETRFVQLTTEVLRADRRFHRELYRVMEQVVSETGAAEGSPNERTREAEGAESGEVAGEGREAKPDRA